MKCSTNWKLYDHDLLKQVNEGHIKSVIIELMTMLWSKIRDDNEITMCRPNACISCCQCINNGLPPVTAKLSDFINETNYWKLCKTMVPGEVYHMWRICGCKWTENRSNGAHYQATICWQMNTHTLTSWSALCKNWCKSFRYKCIKRYGNKQVDVYHYKDKTSWDRVIFIMEIPIPTVLSYDVPTPERMVFYIISRPMAF